LRRACLLGLLPSAVVFLGLRLAGERGFWVAVGLYHLICIVVPALHGATREAFGVGRWRAASLAAGCVLGVSLWAVGREVLARGWLVPPEARAFLARLEPWWFFVAYSLALNALLEEWFWRGFLLARSGVVLGALLFGLMHLAGFSAVLELRDALLLSLPTVAAGLAWGWLRRSSGSLWPCILTHLGADAGILVLLQTIRAS